MWRYLLFKPPIDNRLYESGAIERLLDRRLIAWMWFANIVYIIVIVGIVGLTYAPIEPDFRALQLTFSAAATVIPILLVLLIVSIGASTLMFSLGDKVTDTLRLTALPEGKFIEAVWATLAGQWPYLKLLLAGMGVAFLAWLLRDVLLVRFASLTLILLAHPIILMLQFGLLVNLVLLLSLRLGRARQSLGQAAAFGILAALMTAAGFFGLRLLLIQLLISFTPRVNLAVLFLVDFGAQSRTALFQRMLLATSAEFIILLLLVGVTMLATWLIFGKRQTA